MVSPRERGRYSGYIGAVFALATVSGPLVGGVIVDAVPAPVKDAVDLAMSITQPGHRIRLQTDGVERATVGSYKATIMLTTAHTARTTPMKKNCCAMNIAMAKVTKMR